MIYLDSCALVKLVVAEAESPALERFLAVHADQTHVTAALARTEVRRAVRRTTTKQRIHEAAERLLAQLDHVALDDALLDAAGKADDPAVRSLDAIHLAAARSLGPWLTTFVSYDLRLAEAAKQAGLSVEAPA